MYSEVIVREWHPVKNGDVSLDYLSQGSHKKVSQGWYWTDYRSRYNRLACRAGSGKTEVENAKNKQWAKIYDSGQAKYVLDL